MFIKKNLLWIGIIIALAVILAGAYFLYDSLSEGFLPETPEQVQEVTKAPDFTVTDGTGNKVKLSDMKGKPVVVNFWASWCPPCKAEMPHFESAYEKYGDDVVFMMVDMTDGYQETEEKGRAYIEEMSYTFPVYFDNDMSAAMSYRVNSIPATYFVDKEGNLATYAIGAITGETLEKAVEYIK